jgi:hypothetical protein
MKTRGRTSVAALAIQSPNVETIQRPDAPYDLTDEQSAEWWAIVNRMPADWFPRETHGMLAQYCRHVVRARRLAQLINDMEKLPSEEFDEARYKNLLMAEEVQSRAISSLATRMRISQHSTYDKTKKKAVTATKLPWQPT